MKFALVGLFWAVLAGVAQAEPALCSVTGFESFDCELSRDGGGVSFVLPDGQVFAFALLAPDVGEGYLSAEDAPEGSYPRELGAMTQAVDAPGCWVGGKDGFAFCVEMAE